MLMGEPENKRGLVTGTVKVEKGNYRPNRQVVNVRCFSGLKGHITCRWGNKNSQLLEISPPKKPSLSLSPFFLFLQKIIHMFLLPENFTIAAAVCSRPAVAPAEVGGRLPDGDGL